jgi:hypothetical protein
MSDLLVVPGALVGEADWSEIGPGGVPERIAHRLTRARRQVQAMRASWSDGAAHLEWLARAFQVPGEPPAAAPFAWQAAIEQTGSDAPARSVWFCEPVHLSLQPERTVLGPIAAPPLTESESRELLQEAADSARYFGFDLRPAAGRWYLFADPAWDLSTTPLEAALGASVETRLPQGRHASQWRRLLTEVQMRWHASQANQAREARGDQTANALWLHGGGLWQQLEASRFARVQTDDPVVRGWQRAARQDRGEATDSGSLTLWPHLFEAYWRKDWPAWLTGWTQLEGTLESLLDKPGSGRARPLELVACGRRTAVTFMLNRGGSLLPWRRSALRECLTEPTP